MTLYKNKFEVELKFRVESFDDIENHLVSKKAKLLHSTKQRDQYYRHPCRDFKETDEALRIRRTGDDVCITYKGPKLDAETKTRQEIELPLDVQHDQDWDRLLIKLGFTLSAEVAKTRREFSLMHCSREFHIALDDVAEVGCFIELETIAGIDDLDACRDEIQLLADSLDLKESTRDSYLGLLLKSRGLV